MKERRMARRCRNCREPVPADALLCAKCGSATSELYTRITDPAHLRPLRFEPKRAKTGRSTNGAS